MRVDGLKFFVIETVVYQKCDPDVLHRRTQQVDETISRRRVALQIRHIADLNLEVVVEFVIGAFDECVSGMVGSAHSSPSPGDPAASQSTGQIAVSL